MYSIFVQYKLIDIYINKKYITFYNDFETGLLLKHLHIKLLAILSLSITLPKCKQNCNSTYEVVPTNLFFIQIEYMKCQRTV